MHPSEAKGPKTYSACVLGVWLLRCQRQDQLVFRANWRGDWLGSCQSFHMLEFIITSSSFFNLVVAPTCRWNLHRQPLHQSTRHVKMLLLIELVFEICVISIELLSFEKLNVTLLNSANIVENQPIRIGVWSWILVSGHFHMESVPTSSQWKIPLK